MHIRGRNHIGSDLQNQKIINKLKCFNSLTNLIVT